jgi:MerR family redox-sensitive transcriptional activator SoxR
MRPSPIARGFACVPQDGGPPVEVRQHRPHGHRRYLREGAAPGGDHQGGAAYGIPLKEIGEALGMLPDGRTPTTKDWSELSTQWKADLDDRIGRLTRIRDRLSDCIGCGCLSITDCPLRNPYDELGEAGPRPRLLDPA